MRVLVVCAVVACLLPAQARAVAAEDAAAVQELTIVATGDLLVHQPVWDRALANGNGLYRFRPMFAAIRPTIRGADLALCHMETPLGPGAPSGFPIFNTPPALAYAVKWAGWDACTTASNHSVDQGRAGVRSTLLALERAGLRHTGRRGAAARPADPAHGRGRAPRGDPRRHVRDERPAAAGSVVGEAHPADADHPERAPGPTARRRARDREPPLGRRVRAPADGRADPSRAAAAPQRRDRPDRRPARARRAADPAAVGQVRRLRRGQLPLRADLRLLPGPDPGRARGGRACASRERR